MHTATCIRSINVSGGLVCVLMKTHAGTLTLKTIFYHSNTKTKGSLPNSHTWRETNRKDPSSPAQSSSSPANHSSINVLIHPSINPPSLHLPSIYYAVLLAQSLHTYKYISLTAKPHIHPLMSPTIYPTIHECSPFVLSTSKTNKTEISSCQITAVAEVSILL